MAAQGFGLNNLVSNIPQPEPGYRAAWFASSSAGLDFRDKLLCDGLYNPATHISDGAGADAVGEIVAPGPGTTRFQAGDRFVTSYRINWIDGRPTGSESHAQ